MNTASKEETMRMRWKVDTEYFQAKDAVDLASHNLYEAHMRLFEAAQALEDFEAAQ